ncbi:MAG: ATP-binding cassette domain-containing protein, partial [Beijerinckiaceae bacterium]
METSLAVRARGLTHSYRRQRGLDGISLSFARGRFHAIVGPDGVGKSTLLSLIATARRLQAGDLIVLGEHVGEARGRRRLCHRLAYMPQGLGRNLYPDLTIAEHLDYFADLFGVSESMRGRRGAMLLARTGLAGFESRRARELSGGMKQKLALCCALIHEPELLVLDEPTTGVDPLSRREFWELLRIAHRDRPELTVICATGYVEEAAQFDDIVFLNGGHVVWQGTVPELLQTTQAPNLSAAYGAILAQGAELPMTETAGRGPAVRVDHDIIIEARGLTKRFGGFTAVDHIDVAIRRGEIFAFLGPNGCGKSTTMRMLTGLTAPSEGEITVFGETPRSGSFRLRAGIGYMSQSFSLYGELSVRRNTHLNLTLQHVARGDMPGLIAEVLERFDLDDVADRAAGDLPLGQRQRLALACAVAHKPPLLILDEPTSGVDPSARDMFWRELHRLADEDGATIFVSTHYLSEAERCDRVAFMDQGRILAVAPPAELIAQTGAATLEDAFIAVLEKARGG